MIKKNLKDLIVEYIYSILNNPSVTICYLNELTRNCQNMGHSDFLVSLFYQGADSKKKAISCFNAKPPNTGDHRMKPGFDSTVTVSKKNYALKLV